MDALVLEGATCCRTRRRVSQGEGDAGSGRGGARRQGTTKTASPARRSWTPRNGRGGAFETDDDGEPFQARRASTDQAAERADVTRRRTSRASVASFARLRELFRENAGNHPEEGQSADAFASLVNAAYVAESRAAAAAAAAFEEAARRDAARLAACRRVPPQRERGAARRARGRTARRE